MAHRCRVGDHRWRGSDPGRRWHHGLLGVAERTQRGLQEDRDGRLRFAYLNGYDLLKLPLFERKALLKKIVFETDIQFSESFEIDGREMYKHACKTGLEGVVSKVRDSRYVSGRVNDWVKKTCAQRETLAIAGFALDGGKWDGLYLGGYHLIEMLRQSLFGLPDTRTSTTRTGSVAIATLCLLT
jgi:bifunctional non-homologous end joining protein LigD